MKIVVLVSDNPKRRDAARRFSLYRNGMTPGEYAEAVGNARQAMRDLLWDIEHGWIKLTENGGSAEHTRH